MDLSKLNLGSYLPAMPYKVRELFDKATNMVMNYTDTEVKVVEATNDESWGPPGKLLQDLSQLSYSHDSYNELMGMLWKRCFGQEKRYWRRTYKSLLVLTYLLKNGHDKVLTSAREHLYDLKSLENFAYHDEQGKDQGINVRHKVKDVIEFIHDNDRIRDERKRAKANRDKYIGMSNESSVYRSNDRWNDNDESSSTKKRDSDNHSKSKTKDYSADLSDDENQNWKKYNQTKAKSKPTPEPPKSQPMIDLLGDEVDFSPFVQAPHDDEFGQFQEAVSPTSPVQPSLWPTSTPSTSAITFDPFATSSTSTTNEFDFFQTQPQQSFVPPPMPQQQQQPNQFNPSPSNANTWSSAQGKLDISLNNLIPHTRGNSQKNSLPLNQLTSPTTTQSIFSTLNKK